MDAATLTAALLHSTEVAAACLSLSCDPVMGPMAWAARCACTYRTCSVSQTATYASSAVPMCCPELTAASSSLSCDPVMDLRHLMQGNKRCLMCSSHLVALLPPQLARGCSSFCTWLLSCCRGCAASLRAAQGFGLSNHLPLGASLGLRRWSLQQAAMKSHVLRARQGIHCTSFCRRLCWWGCAAVLGPAGGFGLDSGGASEAVTAPKSNMQGV